MAQNPTAQEKQAAAEWVHIDDLVPWAKNPRRNDHKVHEAASSLRRFGFQAPIVAWGSRKRVVAGHARLKATRLILEQDPGHVFPGAPGPGFVPVRYTEFNSEGEADAYALRDNNPVGEWDPELVAEVIRDLDAQGVELEGLGFPDLDDLLREAAPDLSEVEEDEAPEVDEAGAPDSETGAIYLLGTGEGAHWLLCGDCREPGDAAKLLHGVKVNIAFTSPPYASQRKYDEASGFKPISPDEYVDWFEAVQANVRNHLAPDGSWFVNIKEHCEDGQRHLYVKDLTIAHVRRWGWRFVDELVWKHRGLPGAWNNRFKNCWEPVFHFAGRDGIRFRPEAVGHESEDCFHEGGRISDTNRTGNVGWHGSDVERMTGNALPGNVVDLPNSPANHDHVSHSAAFPVGLPEFFIRAYTDPGDIVFEPFAGSGTTLIASAKQGRVCRAIEISPRYCDLIRRRWTAFAKKAGIDPGPGSLE